MSLISNTAVPRQIVGGGVLAKVAAGLKHVWQIYMVRRMRRVAIARLSSLSDRQLEDMGLTRSQIKFAVVGEAALDRAVCRYY